MIPCDFDNDDEILFWYLPKIQGLYCSTRTNNNNASGLNTAKQKHPHKNNILTSNCVNEPQVSQ